MYILIEELAEKRSRVRCIKSYLCFLTRVFQPTISKEYKKGDKIDGINIVSYNVEGFIGRDSTEGLSTMNKCIKSGFTSY